MMDKARLHDAILAALEGLKTTAEHAALQAYESATHEENVAENKYDTLGLEASYLAEGQSNRLAECEADLNRFRHLTIKTFTEDEAIGLGALIQLKEQASGLPQWLFLSPVSGGLEIKLDTMMVRLVTPSAPLGKALLGQYLEDEIEVMNKRYLIQYLG